MNTRFFSIHRVAALMSLAVLFGAGPGGEAEAGKVVKRKVRSVVVRKAKQATDTVLPVPLVDDSPINPGAKPDSSAKDSTGTKRTVRPRKTRK